MAKSPAFPIELKQLVFTNVNVHAIPSHTPSSDGKESEVLLENNFNVVNLDPENKVYAVSMTSQFNLERDASVPYLIDVSCIATFAIINDSMSEEDLLKALTVTGHSIVYGAIRETVLSLTSRSVYGPFTFGIDILQPPPPIPKENLKT